MEVAEIVNALQVVEVTAKTRATTLRTVAQATGLEAEGVVQADLLEALEEREATAQTIVDVGFALPHAIIDWDGDYRVVLGRSRAGIEYGRPDTEPVQLVFLLVIGRRKKDLQLQLLAAVAELLGSEDFRKDLISAPDTRTILRLLQEKVGLGPEKPGKRAPGVPRVNTVLVRQSVELAATLSAQAVLIATTQTDSIPWETLLGWPGRLLVVTPPSTDDLAVNRADTHFIDLPQASLTRMDQANLGLLLSASKGLLKADSEVVCVTGPGSRRLDNICVIRPQAQFQAMFSSKAKRRTARIPPAVIQRALTLAIEMAEEGREGKPIGTVFVLGDARNVVRHSQQLVLNPFHGYSRSLRSLLDPSLGETIKEFAQLDGAFVIQADGMVLSAGTYLVPKSTTAKLPSGLGTRHQAAASITSHTEAMAIAVSQSTGTVTVFRNGRIVLKLQRATGTRA